MQGTPKKLGIIGCGAIGSNVARHVRQRLPKLWSVVGLCASTPASAAALAEELQVPVLERSQLLERCDCIVEATRAAVMPAIVRDCLAAQVPVLTVSVGGFALDTDLQREVEESGLRVHVPSGAIAGLDGIMALREQGLDTVELLTVKHPHSLPTDVWEQACLLYGASDFPAGLASVDSRVIFTGSASEAIRLFPANANVAIALSLAGVGFQATQVRILADPQARTTIHCVRARAGQSMLECTTRPVPLAANPRSSLLAVMSVIGVLRKLASSLQIGT